MELNEIDALIEQTHATVAEARTEMKACEARIKQGTEAIKALEKVRQVLDPDYKPARTYNQTLNYGERTEAIKKVLRDHPVDVIHTSQVREALGDSMGDSSRIGQAMGYLHQKEILYRTGPGVFRINREKLNASK